MGANWYGLAGIKGNNFLIFNSSWRRNTNLRHDPFRTLPSVCNRIMVATENYLIAYYETNILSCTIWRISYEKIDTVHAVTANIVAITQISENINLHGRWSLKSISPYEDHKGLGHILMKIVPDYISLYHTFVNIPALLIKNTLRLLIWAGILTKV